MRLPHATYAAKLFITSLLLTSVAPLFAQQAVSNNSFSEEEPAVPTDSTSSSTDTPTSANTAPLFTPLAFYHSVTSHALSPQSSDDAMTLPEKALLHIYLTRPDLVKTSGLDLDDAETILPEKPDRKPAKMPSGNLPSPTAPTFHHLDVDVKKPNFWTYTGDFSLQAFQNYISSNWYKGGESNYAFVSALTIEANYNNKQKVKWDNKLEMKLGMQSSKSDSLHTLKTSEDLLRYTGKVGLQAAHKWYYTVQLMAYTQFAKGYKSNDPIIYSDFLSPLNVNISLGMDYTIDWIDGRLKGSAHIAPLAANYRHVKYGEMATRYSIDEGKHSTIDIGSELTTDITWKFSDIISWKSRLYAFTAYNRTEMEWENTFIFNLTKHLTSNFFVYPRFDDGTDKDDHHGYWQFKEFFSMGVDFKF